MYIYPVIKLLFYSQLNEFFFNHQYKSCYKKKNNKIINQDEKKISLQH